mgnify:FL=1
MIRTYSELVSLPSYLDRYKYLKIGSKVGVATFGFNRYLNQSFYQSSAWKRVRDQVIIRDDGCDLAHADYPIAGRIYIHHLNPIRIDDLEDFNPDVLDPNNLVCVSFGTHQAIHYGDESLLPNDPIERFENDQIPWR